MAPLKKPIKKRKMGKDAGKGWVLFSAFCSKNVHEKLSFFLSYVHLYFGFSELFFCTYMYIYIYISHYSFFFPIDVLLFPHLIAFFYTSIRYCHSLPFSFFWVLPDIAKTVKDCIYLLLLEMCSVLVNLLG